MTILLSSVLVLQCHSKTLSHWDTPKTHREACAIMMVGDVLAPNRRQAISNHHVVSSATTDYEY